MKKLFLTIITLFLIQLGIIFLSNTGSPIYFNELDSTYRDIFEQNRDSFSESLSTFNYYFRSPEDDFNKLKKDWNKLTGMVTQKKHSLAKRVGFFNRNASVFTKDRAELIKMWHKKYWKNWSSYMTYFSVQDNLLCFPWIKTVSKPNRCTFRRKHESQLEIYWDFGIIYYSAYSDKIDDTINFVNSYANFLETKAKYLYLPSDFNEFLAHRFVFIRGVNYLYEVAKDDFFKATLLPALEKVSSIQLPSVEASIEIHQIVRLGPYLNENGLGHYLNEIKGNPAESKWYKLTDKIRSLHMGKYFYDPAEIDFLGNKYFQLVTTEANNFMSETTPKVLSTESNLFQEEFTFSHHKFPLFRNGIGLNVLARLRPYPIRKIEHWKSIHKEQTQILEKLKKQ